MKIWCIYPPSIKETGKNKTTDTTPKKITLFNNCFNREKLYLSISGNSSPKSFPAGCERPHGDQTAVTWRNIKIAEHARHKSVINIVYLYT